MRLLIHKPILCCLVLLAGLAPTPASGAGLSGPLGVPAPAASSGAATKACHPAAALAVPVLVADNWWTWSSIYRGLESCLSSRAGLLRVGVIGMVIALVIIMFGNKWGK
jgi:hypothetical protein